MLVRADARRALFLSSLVHTGDTGQGGNGNHRPVEVELGLVGEDGGCLTPNATPRVPRHACRLRFRFAHCTTELGCSWIGCQRTGSGTGQLLIQWPVILFLPAGKGWTGAWLGLVRAQALPRCGRGKKRCEPACMVACKDTGLQVCSRPAAVHETYSFTCGPWTILIP